MNRDKINECAHLSDEEKISFPEVIGRLISEGVESYYVDLLSLNKTYYAKNSAYTTECLHKHQPIVASSFNQEGIVKAIRQSQAGEIKYQEFLKKIMAAGCIAYMVFIQGRKAVYFGRLGEEHVEKFPD